uniref:Torsin A interacting protein 2 n=2 Tax=Nothobranchius rachovii TaxID=451742 RepID=A0A1A8PKX4_9TELE
MSKITATNPPRRSTRHLGRALSVEPTPREPIKRTKRPSEDRSAAAVKDTREVENGLEDEDSPSKKPRLDALEADGDGTGENEMEVQEPTKERQKNEDQEMNTEAVPSDEIWLPKTGKGAIGDVNSSPYVFLGERCPVSHSLKEDSKCVKQKTAVIKDLAPPHKSAFQVRPPEKRHDVPIRSMADYRRTLEAKVEITDKPKVNHSYRTAVPVLEKPYTTRQRVNYIPAQKQTIQLPKKEAAKKTSGTSENSCRGFMWYLWRLVFLLLLSSATLLAYSIIPELQRSAVRVDYGSREVKPEMFLEHLFVLETQFPSQRVDLWKRSRIHLEKHLKSAHPTGPVSLMLAAGVKAERTLRCLAHGLASTYSSALNASVFYLDGQSKVGQDSDEVKLDIDNQLRAAFEGDKPVAVIHRFEELPPGSTQIFYRYCDHETAAYKQVFLLFTVVLPQDEISSEMNLEQVEESVHDYTEEKLVSSMGNSAYNQMDTDKFSGLWSRISHLVLPVVSENRIGQGECP